MALAYSGGTLVKTTIAAPTTSAFVTGVHTAMTTAGWTAVAYNSGYEFTSATTPEGLSMKFRCFPCQDPPPVSGWGGTVEIGAVTTDDGDVTGVDHVYVGGATTYEFIANRYSVWNYQLGQFTNNTPYLGILGAGNAFAAGVPYLPEPVRPLIVSAATNTSPIQITTTTDHGMLTGDSCYVVGVLGNTGANGNFTITKVNDTAFTLDASVGTGAYTSGGIVGNRERISRFIYFWGTSGAYANQYNGWRHYPNQTASVSALDSRSNVIVNENNYSSVGTNPTLFAATSYPWRGGRFTMTEPYLRCTNTGSGNTLVQAQLYNAMIVTGSVAPAGDSVFTADGHTWVIYNQGGSGVIDLAVVQS